MSKRKKHIRAESPPTRSKRTAPAADRTWFANLSSAKKDLLCIAVLYIVTLILFNAIVFENAAFQAGGDTAAAMSYRKASENIKEAEGIDPLWSPYFFSGMPTFGNVAYVPYNVSYLEAIVVNALDFLFLKGRWTWLVVYYFLSGVFMFLLMRALKFSRAPALLAALIFMLNPYGIGLAGEGHGSKLKALSYLPLVFLLTHWMFERRNILSFGLLIAGTGTLLLTNHMQIVYYAFIVIGLYLVYHIVLDFKQSKILAAKKTGLFLGALLLGLCISSYVYLSVYDYAQYSIRGGGTTGSAGGLSYDYATNWSFNPLEIIDYLIPSFFGFSSSYSTVWNGRIQPLPLYWGTMPFNTSSVYVGVIPIVLSVIALVYRRNKMTIFLALLSALVFLVSFGKHFPLFYDLWFDYMPFFNKFRAPVMMLHLIAFTTAILSAYGLTFLIETRVSSKEFNVQKLKKVLLTVTAGLGATLILVFLMKSSIYKTLAEFMFVKEGEQYGAQTQQIIAAFKQIRFDLLWNDFIKFALIAGASLGAIVLFLNKKIQSGTFSGAIIVILLIDLVIVDVKFINPQPSGALEKSFQPDATISFLKKQPGLFRIYPVAQPYGDNAFAYHGIQSVGGYSPAKLKIYQEMVDSAGLYPPRFPVMMNIINMLNAKYLVAPGRLPEDKLEIVNVDESKGLITYLNHDYLPRAWFVDTIAITATGQEKFRLLKSPTFDPKHLAVLDHEPSTAVARSDSTDVEIVSYGAHEIRLKTFSSARSLLVLSEIYYPAGWKAYVDSNETEVFRTNSILRSVVVPSGNHEVVFKFDPLLYRIGWVLSNTAWGATAVCILIGLWQIPSVRQRLHKKYREHEVTRS